MNAVNRDLDASLVCFPFHKGEIERGFVVGSLGCCAWPALGAVEHGLSGGLHYFPHFGFGPLSFVLTWRPVLREAEWTRICHLLNSRGIPHVPDAV